MLEFEKKIMLTKQEYNAIAIMHSGDSKTFVQVNHYYDSDIFEMNRNGITCRIREKNGSYTATFKAHQSADSKCSIEQSKEVSGPFDDSLFKDMNVKFQGSLVTRRTVICKESGLEVVLDENTYLGVTDYELEIEYLLEKSERAGVMLRYVAQSLFLDELAQMEFCKREKFVKSKSARFFERLMLLREHGKKDDISRPKFYITGDKHRQFDGVKAFCRKTKTCRDDVLIILGDTGFNYYGDERDDKLKSEISKLNITLFCLHGNKENRPQNVGTYGLRNFCGGKVLYEPRFPNIFFAIDGEVYDFEGQKYITIGGAHSVDKKKCIEENLPFWEDEMPDDAVKMSIEKLLEERKYNIFGMMTHTCPLKYIPTEMFVSTRRNAEDKRDSEKKRNNACKFGFGKAKRKKKFELDIDRSTEAWLDKIEDKLEYSVWFCGHYHADKQIDKVYMMYHEIRPLHCGRVD